MGVHPGLSFNRMRIESCEQKRRVFPYVDSTKAFDIASRSRWFKVLKAIKAISCPSDPWWSSKSLLKMRCEQEPIGPWCELLFDKKVSNTQGSKVKRSWYVIAPNYPLPPLFRCFLFPGYWFPPVRGDDSVFKKKVIQQVKWPYASFYLPLMLNETS